MKKKQCFKCKKEKSLYQFYKHPQMKGGHVNKCKDCNKKDVKENYRVNRDHYVSYERERFRKPERKKKVTEYQRKRRRLHPQKYKARSAVSNALRSGRLKRLPCEICGVLKVEAHHEDYSKPLEVRWLCFKHHREVHGQKISE